MAENKHIKEINFDGTKVKCEVKFDIITIVLLIITTFVIPIWMFCIESIIVGMIVHIVSLIGIIISRGTIFRTYKPIKEDKQQW